VIGKIGKPLPILPLFSAYERDSRMTLTLQGIYGASWLWLLWWLVAIILGFTANWRGQKTLFKTNYYFLVGLFLLQMFVPDNHVAIRNLLFDLSSRFYLLISTVELFWIECSQIIRPLPPTHVDAKSAGNPPPIHPGELSRSYLLRVVYGLSSLIFLGWLLLGLVFASTRI
jgi:hypothetical protein